MKKKDDKGKDDWDDEMIAKARDFAIALLANPKNLTPRAALKEFLGKFNPGESETIDLTGVTDFAPLAGCSVIPTPGVAAYLATGDILTDNAIDQMEIAIEKAHGIKKPFFITSERKGKEARKNLKVTCFYLGSTEQ